MNTLADAIRVWFANFYHHLTMNADRYRSALMADAAALALIDQWIAVQSEPDPLEWQRKYDAFAARAAADECRALLALLNQFAPISAAALAHALAILGSTDE